MILRKNIRFAVAIALSGVLGIAGHVSARENVTTARHKDGLKTTATSGCNPASATIDIDVNNVRARLMTGGDMWWNTGTGSVSYEIPKGSGKQSNFAASCWIGGYDKQGQLKVAAQTYRQDGNDYWPGALNPLGKISADTCLLWDRFWKIDRVTLNQFISMYKSGGDVTGNSLFDPINQWPASGNKKAKGSDNKTNLALNPNNTYAPFKDLNNDGLYQPEQGEYPDITGDQFIWWVFNDAGNVKQQTSTAAMGIEVQTSAFAYATQDFLNNATFANYRVINRGALTIDSTYIAVWDDCDLGWHLDDYIGCDTSRGLGIQYNATNDDGGNAGHPVYSYGLNPPQIGLDFFQGPIRVLHRAGLPDTTEQLGMTNFTYYNNDGSIIGNPNNGIQIYYYMTGSIRTGQRFSNDFAGANSPSRGYGSGPITNFVYFGDPGDNTTWSECACNNNPSDRRFIFSSGPFQLLPGAVNDITFGCVWAKNAGGCPATNFKAIRNIDDQAQALFDNKFKTIEGPEAPRMVVRELDRKLVFYLVNDYGSNNYGENYGRIDAGYDDSLQYHQIAVKAKGRPDSLYKFQGYRVFQLANSEVKSSEIFNPTTGEVDNTKAFEVFQCDVRDGVAQIVNYSKLVNISDTTSMPQVKVIGRDSGIAHSFVLTNDQFSTDADKRFINYHTYYFVAIAYAHNNFLQFNPLAVDTTQDVPYLGSSHGAAGSNIEVVAALPNPAFGAMGTILNSDYGSGVVITRMEGVGNGGNDIALDSPSEEQAVLTGSVAKATYKVNQGPVSVKVVDPVKVPAYNWVLQIMGASSSLGIMDTAKWKLTAFVNGTPETIYSETSIAAINEQIIEKYGISVELKQVKAPGVDQKGGNGYITSEVIFSDPSQPWLWGLQDQSDSSFANWIRAGANGTYDAPPDALKNPCNFNDYSGLDSFKNYQNLLGNFSPLKSSWAPYDLVAAYFALHAGTGTQCGFQFAYSPLTQLPAHFRTLPDVDVVFDPNKANWTRCAVVEMQEDPALAQGRAPKFYLRNHRSWDLKTASDGNTPIYSDVASDTGMSWFPGYAIDQNTGKRLNIVFGEDSYLSSDNGNDMVWNPTSSRFSLYDNSILFGGKHAIYILDSKYDSCKAFATELKKANPGNPSTPVKNAFTAAQWVGVPLANPSIPLKSISEGIIPNKTRLRFRVNRPYAPYHAVSDTSVASLPGLIPGKATNPYYTFNTTTLSPTLLSDTSDRSRVLDRIYAVPNPYYGYSGYERNRYDTKVRIINLPAQATVHIYSLDGSLIRTLSKNDPNTSYIDWDIKNTAGLPIASGMYIMNVKAVGIGETVLKWFGAMRPLDVTSY